MDNFYTEGADSEKVSGSDLNNIFEEKKGSNGKGMDVVGRNCTWLCKAT